MEGPRHKNVTFAGGFNIWQDRARVRSRVRAYDRCQLLRFTWSHAMV